MFKFIIFVFTLGLSQANCQAVNVELYFESLCPDSINFITTQLYPTWEALHQTGELLQFDFKCWKIVLIVQIHHSY